MGGRLVKRLAPTPEMQMRVWWTLTIYPRFYPHQSTPSAPDFGVEIRGDAKVSMHDHLGDQRDGRDQRDSRLLCHIRSHIWGPVIFPLAVSLSTPSVNSGRVRCEAERVGSGWSTSRVRCTRKSRFCTTFSRLAPHPPFYSTSLRRDSVILRFLS
jgi:hypothetical protein